MPTRPSPSCAACVESSSPERSRSAPRCTAAGSHALARGADQPLVPLERYRKLAKLLGDGVSRQLVCGLHVHVSLPDWETCLRAFEGVLPWLPTLLALSANSPFAEGEATGRRSERAVRLLDLPTGGTPPVLRNAADWESATAGDQGRRHWDAWPRPGYGTLEVRVMDMQTDVRRSAGLAELVGALVARGRGERARDLRSRPLRAAARAGDARGAGPGRGRGAGGARRRRAARRRGAGRPPRGGTPARATARHRSRRTSSPGR